MGKTGRSGGVSAKKSSFRRRGKTASDLYERTGEEDQRGIDSETNFSGRRE
ncbi:MAG: hypothetical protein II313_02645 [Anaerotignum sp.]|nr:hypothetical protein [Anaerotignum sp.]